MTRPIAPITTVKYDATYQWDGFTLSNAGLGEVPKAPPMMSIVTIGNANTKVSTSGSRVMSFSSAAASRPTAVFIVVLQQTRAARSRRRIQRNVRFPSRAPAGQERRLQGSARAHQGRRAPCGAGRG